jgi:hypothetical protein
MAITTQQSTTIPVREPGTTVKPPSRLGGFARAAFDRVFGNAITRRAQLAVRALDDVRDAIISGQSQLERDRFTADREDIQRDALLAWRTNPIAKRIVSLTTQYVIGEGFTVASKHAGTHKFINQWWVHRLNRMDVRVNEWCDELTRAGNLIVLVSTDAAGMSYVRALPVQQVQTIITRPNDVEQPLAIVEKMQWGASLVSTGVGVEGQPVMNAGSAPYMATDPTYGVVSTGPTDPAAMAGQPNDGTGQPGRGPWTWPAYDETSDGQNDDGTFPTVALHYAINRPVAAAFGESDLAPLLRWLARYTNWLEDRARLNRFRQAFMYVVTGTFQSKADRLARQAELNANPPTPGSILVKDIGETWEILHPQLSAHDAADDGLALKKIIAAGSANPLHFLAEPESATRTTAESAGGPTFRHYEQRQNFFMWLLSDVMDVVTNRRALVDPSVDPDAEITLTGSPISVRDDATRAQAAGLMITAVANLRDRQVIDDQEMLRMVYRFADEDVMIDEMIARGRKAGVPLWPAGSGIKGAAPTAGGPEAPGGPPQPPDAAVPKPPGVRTVSPD